MVKIQYNCRKFINNKFELIRDILGSVTYEEECAFILSQTIWETISRMEIYMKEVCWGVPSASTSLRE